MFKKLAKFVAVALGLVLVVGGVVYLKDHRYWDRYILITKNQGILSAEGWAGSEYPVAGGQHSLFELVDPASRTIDSETLDDITRYAAERNSSSLLIWQGGALQWRRHFQGFDTDTPVVGKSMAKMVLGVVVGIAIEQGHIRSLDEPVATYIDEWQGTDKAAITIRHLLHMSAGLEKFYTMDYGPFSKYMRSYLSGHHEKIIINDYDLVDEPGTQYDYSQVSSDLIGVVLERAIGKPYGQYLSEVLIQPIGAQGGEVMMNRPNGVAHTGCCLLLPSESWLRIGLLLMHGGRINGASLFADGWMDEYLAPSPSNPALGLHIWLGQPYLKQRSFIEVGEATRYGVLHSEPYLAPDLFLFDGSGNQVIYIVPSEELVIVRTGDRTRGENIEWDNAYIPNAVIRSLRRTP